MWQWHTRTWISNGALHETARVGLGWYIVVLATVVIINVGARILDR